MSSLTFTEFSNLKMKKTVRVCVIAAVICSVLIAFLNVLHQHEVSLTESRDLRGFEAIAQMRETYHGKAGFLTEDVLYEAGASMEEAYQPQNMKRYDDGSLGPTNEAYAKYVISQGGLTRLFMTTFDYENPMGSYNVLSEMTGKRAAAFYRVRDGLVRYHLDLVYPPNPEKAGEKESIDRFALSLEEKVRKPFYYDYFCGWETSASNFGLFLIMIAFFCCICAAPVFAGDYQSSMDSVLFCCRYGRSRLPRARTRASMLFSASLYGLCTLVYFGLFLLIFGPYGWNCPIQFTSVRSPVPLNYLQLHMLAWLAGLLGCLAMTGVTLLFSSAMRRPLPVIVGAAVLLFAPAFVPNALYTHVKDFLYLLPTSAFEVIDELFKVNMFFLFGRGVWTPAAIACSSIVVNVFSSVCASKSFAGHLLR